MQQTYQYHWPTLSKDKSLKLLIPGAPEWPSLLRIQLLIAAQAMISMLWDQAPPMSPHSAGNQLETLSPLSLCPLPTLSLK